MRILELVALIAVILAVDIVWINIDKQSFLDWGWVVVSLIGFAIPVVWGSVK